MIDKARGYIIIYRSILDSPIWTNPKLLRIYFWILLRAGYETKDIFRGTERVTLHPGQFVTSYPHMSEGLGMSVGSIKTYLDCLKAERIIEIKSTNKYTVITVQSWDELQNPERKSENKMKTERAQNETSNTFNTSKEEQNPDSLSQDEKNSPESALWGLAGKLSDKKLEMERRQVLGGR